MEEGHMNVVNEYSIFISFVFFNVQSMQYTTQHRALSSAQ